MNQGQVGANQSIGGSNVISSALQQYLQNIIGNQFLSNLNLGGG